MRSAVNLIKQRVPFTEYACAPFAEFSLESSEVRTQVCPGLILSLFVQSHDESIEPELDLVGQFGMSICLLVNLVKSWHGLILNWLLLCK